MQCDTDVVIWLLRANAKAIDRVDRAAERRVSIVTFMELLQGARSRRESSMIRAVLRDLSFEILPVTEEVGAVAATIIEEHALARGIQVADALVAATAIEQGLILCSANAKHYRAIEGLQLDVFRP